MRNLILSALILASAFQTALGETWGDYTYTVADGKVTITSYDGMGGQINVPARINDLPVVGFGIAFSATAITGITIPGSVTSIAHGAFSGCSQLTSIVIPETVLSIGATAFVGCTLLTTVTLPSGLTSIGMALFQNCSSLSAVTIPSGVTTIGNFAFQNCIKLSNLTIPSGVTDIGGSTFEGCVMLKGVYFQGNAPTKGAGVFTYSTPTVYYLSGTTGWGANFAGRPTALTGTFSLALQYDSSKGSVELSPSQAFYSGGTGVTVKAIAKQGYVFGGWSGDYATISSGIILENFQVLHETTVIMNSNKTVGVTFLQDNNDSDSDGLTNFQESTVYISNPYQADSNSDGYNDGLAVSLGYSPSINFSALISHLQSHPPTGLYTASQIQSMAIGDLVLTKNTNGSFTLNYDIEQSTDLQTWTTYAPLSLPLTGLPTDKAFVRIKVKQDGVSNVSNSQTTPTTPTFGSSYTGGSGVSPNYATPNYNGGSSAISPNWLNSLPSLPSAPPGPIEDE